MSWDILAVADAIGVAVFAASGALEASRKRMDIVGFALLATLTGIGGGTLRDLLMDRPVFWLQEPVFLAICLGTAAILFLLAPAIERRQVWLVWLDAVGLALFAVLGTSIAISGGLSPLPALIMGVMTATFGGLLRDVVSNEEPLILSHEIYATAAALSAGIWLVCWHVTTDFLIAGIAGGLSGFLLRAGGIHFGWALPRYRPRDGRPRQ